MRVTVRFFAILKDRAGASEAEIELPDDSTIQAAVEMVRKRFPGIEKDVNRSAFAVNRNYSALQTILNNGDELALIPPVSGG